MNVEKPVRFGFGPRNDAHNLVSSIDVVITFVDFLPVSSAAGVPLRSLAPVHDFLSFIAKL